MDQEELQYDGDTNEEALLQETAAEDFNDTDNNMESELEAIKSRVKEMEDEAEKLRQIQSEVDEKMRSPSGAAATASTSAGPPAVASLTMEEKMEADLRSIYVGQVDYGATAEELEQHFHGCGAVNRVTIQCNKFDGHPKGFAYIEFADKDSVTLAMALDESLFRGRQLKVMPKRTNRPGMSSTNRFPKGSRRGGGRGVGRFAASLVAAVLQQGFRPRRPRRHYNSYSPY